MLKLPENFKFQHFSPPEIEKSAPEDATERERKPKRISPKLKRLILESILAAASLCSFYISSNIGSRKIEESYYFTGDDYIEYVSKKENLSPTERKELAKEVYFIVNQVGDSYLQLMKEGARKKAAPGEVPKLKNWEETGMTKEERNRLRQAILETYPPHLVKGTIERIVFKKEFEDLPSSYGLPQESKRGAELKLFDNIITIEGVDFHNKKSKEREKLLLMINSHFTHELAHYHDWLNNPNLTDRQRIKFLYEVLSNYNQSNTPHYSYELQIKNDDKFLEQQIKIEEWWAETCDNYFNLPFGFIRRYPKEASLVERWLKIDRQEFDAIYNLIKRTDILFGCKEIKDKNRI